MTKNKKDHQDIQITKASGERSSFVPQKLIESLQKAGANAETIRSIMQDIEGEIFDGITTKKIYQLAFGRLKRHATHVAARYKLKRAIMELGPSGYPFERYFAYILQHQGYQVKHGQFIQGHCINHEVDVVAAKGNRVLLCECKYHNRSGVKSDVKVPLYIHSRFRDIVKELNKNPENEKLNFECWIITNTSFTEDAVQYAVCSGINLLSWDFPGDGNLKSYIEASALYPITCLTTLTNKEKSKLLEQKIVLSNELQENENALLSIGIKKNKISKVLEEVHFLCKDCN